MKGGPAKLERSELSGEKPSEAGTRGVARMRRGNSFAPKQLNKWGPRSTRAKRVEWGVKKPPSHWDGGLAQYAKSRMVMDPLILSFLGLIAIQADIANILVNDQPMLFNILIMPMIWTGPGSAGPRP